MTGDLCKKKNFGNLWILEQRKQRVEMSSTNCFTRGSVSFWNTIKGEEDKSFLLGVAVLTKVMPSHSDPRPVRLLLLGIPLIKEQERSKGSAVGIRPVGKGLLNPDSLLEMSKFWGSVEGQQTLFVPNLLCHCCRSCMSVQTKRFFYCR